MALDVERSGRRRARSATRLPSASLCHKLRTACTSPHLYLQMNMRADMPSPTAPHQRRGEDRECTARNKHFPVRLVLGKVQPDTSITQELPWVNLLGSKLWHLRPAYAAPRLACCMSCQSSYSGLSEQRASPIKSFQYRVQSTRRLNVLPHVDLVEVWETNGQMHCRK